MSENIDIVVNGESRNVPHGTTVTALIGLLGLGDRRVATTLLAAGDHLELVTFVGGG
jgi:sulfur carrier protein ThiS